ncbi:unnamed protein product [Camellia sinensis]
MQEKGSVIFAVDYEFAARLKPTEEYVSKYKGNYTFTGGKAVGYRNLFGIAWTLFMAEDNLFLINRRRNLNQPVISVFDDFTKSPFNTSCFSKRHIINGM